tara:strand:- start:215 stop:418 length:204 start_codon:yes stop_codon:yes gene_type:complete
VIVRLKPTNSHDEIHESSIGVFVVSIDKSPDSEAAALGRVSSPVKDANRRRNTNEILPLFRLESLGA